MEEIHVSALVIEIIGGVLTLLFAIIAFFLSRLVKQFDGLTHEVGELNKTMVRIDKDLSGDVGILKTENCALKQEVKDLNPLWDRMRQAEEDIAVLQKAGCSKMNRCNQ